MNSSYNIQRTFVTPEVRISSAAVYYDEIWGERWQYETFIFSDGDFPVRQYIHGNGGKHDVRLEAKAKRFHRLMVRVVTRLLKKAG